MINILTASDNTLLVQFGNKISKKTSHQLLNLANYIIKKSVREITNVSPAYNSLMVRLSDQTSLSDGKKILNNFIKKSQRDFIYIEKLIEIPVCYNHELGPDLTRVSDHTGYNLPEIISLHTNMQYFVHFIGFSLGFPYMSGLDVGLETPRLKSPRTRVSKGSIGIAGKQTGIYPISTPGGWNIIGRTPLKLFDKTNPLSNIILSGNKVRFKSISFEEYEKLRF
tara:strand:+ start:239 stop:910 length:672 start_codon:yes stop_codon:yes gene_type:complete